MVRKKSATLILLSGLVHIMLFAQGKVGINTTSPLAMFHVADSSVLFTSPFLHTGNPPVSGAGIRMMWYPAKAAFRAGNVSGTQWNKENIGNNSIALGLNVRASGLSAVALGSGNTSSGSSSSAFGTNNIASGDYSLATGAGTTATGTHSFSGGYLSQASGNYSFSFGWQSEATESYATAVGFGASATALSSVSLGSSTTAAGFASTALGYSTKALSSVSLACGYGTNAHGYSSLVAGLYNDPIVAIQTSIASTTPLFIIGNGDNDTTRSNAMVVRKDGTIGIGTNTPDDLLHIYKGNSGGTANSNAALVVEDNAAVAINLLTPNANSSAVYFGNASNNAHGGIVYNSTTSNGLAFRTNGNSTKMVVTDIGRVGIGTTTPDALIHTANGAGGGVYHIDADIIIEDDNAAYLQFSTTDSQLAGIFSGNNSTGIRSGILFRIENSMDLRAGGDITRLRVENDGDINVFDGEMHRSATTEANLLPICYGSVSSAGAILGGTGNYSVTNPSGGRYDVSISGEFYNSSDFSVIVTPIATSARMSACTASGSGSLIVRVYDSAGTLTNTAFHFVVYQQ